MSYKKDTVGRLADTYYSSVFSGEPGSQKYNTDDIVLSKAEQNTRVLFNRYCLRNSKKEITAGAEEMQRC